MGEPASCLSKDAVAVWRLGRSRRIFVGSPSGFNSRKFENASPHQLMEWRTRLHMDGITRVHSNSENTPSPCNGALEFIWNSRRRTTVERLPASQLSGPGEVRHKFVVHLKSTRRCWPFPVCRCVVFHMGGVCGSLMMVRSEMKETRKGVYQAGSAGHRKRWRSLLTTRNKLCLPRKPLRTRC